MSDSKKTPSNNDRQLTVRVAITLACKIAVIACLGFLFFGSDTRVETNAQTVGQALLADITSNSSTAPNP